MIGTRLGSFRVTARLGEGGMGVVYRARDVDLQRDVALKVLPEGFTADHDRLARLEREAKILARLNHPNIAQIYGLVVHGDSRVLVMELVEGPTLAERLAAGPLPVDEAASIARQIAEALEEAHDKGIIHRDLKPQNVKAPVAGRAKVLDFGLAKSTRPAGALSETQFSDGVTASFAPTGAGVILGTAPYMAPEQARGGKIDRRVDIWAFGVVLYEMLTGGRLFAADTLAGTLDAVASQPIDFSRLPGATPPRLRELLRRCLERDPRQRLRDIGEARLQLQGLSAVRPTGPEGSGGPAAGATVAVLPFVNLSASEDDEYFADGLTEDVIAHLAKVRSLRVISRTSVMAFKRREQSLREVGAVLGAGVLLEGSVRRAGARVRIVAQLIDRDTDEHIWAESYDRDLTDIFAIQTDVALKITAALRAELSPDERRRMSRYPTHDLEAYELYAQGRQYLSRFTADGLRRCQDLLQRAIARDPSFALAHATLAYAYADQVFEGIVGQSPGSAFRLAKESAARALALDDALGEAHGVAGLLRFTCDYDWPGAEREFHVALELSPGSADLYDQIGWLYAALERNDEALEAVTRARELDPLAHSSDVGTTLLRAGRFGEALAEGASLIAAEPGFARGHSIAGWAHLFLGHGALGLAGLERAAELTPDATLFLAQLGQAYGMAGEVGRARDVLARLSALAAEQYVSPYHFAYVHTGLGEHDRAIDWLERAYEQRAGAIYGIKGSFLFKPLRGHPRFEALLARMNLA